VVSIDVATPHAIPGSGGNIKLWLSGFGLDVGAHAVISIWSACRNGSSSSSSCGTENSHNVIECRDAS